MSWLVALPIVIPLAAACIAMLGWRSPVWQKGVCILGATGLIVAACALLASVEASGGYRVLYVGAWRAPYGITLVADRFSALLVVLASIAGLGAMVFSLSEDDGRVSRPFLFPLVSVLLVGVCGAFLTGDLFNLYVWFEVLLMASFVLLALGGGRGQLDAALKYVALNLLSSVLFLIAAGLLYGVAGTLNFADLARIVPAAAPSGELLAIGALLLIAFGIKAALFPVFFWLPASYHTPPFAVSGVFAALLTKVGVYSIFRASTLVFPAQTGEFAWVLAWVAGLSMVVGVLGAASQQEIRRILAFHSVSQMGYILMGLVIGTPAGLGAGVFFFLHHGIVKTNLFFIAGVMERATGSNDLRHPALSGLLRSSPLLAAAFLVTALSLAGIPPLSGFPAKLGLIVAGIDVGRYGLVGVAAAVGLLTTYSMLKIWAEAFWRGSPPGEAEKRSRIGNWMLVPIVFTVLTVVLGVLGGPVVAICARAGEQLADREGYIRAVAPIGLDTGGVTAP